MNGTKSGGTTYPVATNSDNYSANIRHEFSVTTSYNDASSSARTYNTLHFPTVQKALAYYYSDDMVAFRKMDVHISGDVIGVDAKYYPPYIGDELHRHVLFNNDVQCHIMMRKTENESDTICDVRAGIIQNDVFGDLGELHTLHLKIVIQAVEYIQKDVRYIAGVVRDRGVSAKEIEDELNARHAEQKHADNIWLYAYSNEQLELLKLYLEGKAKSEHDPMADVEAAIKQIT